MKRIFVIAAALLMMVGCKERVVEGPAMAANYNEVSHGSIAAEAMGNDVNDKYAEFYGNWAGYISVVDTAAYDSASKNAADIVEVNKQEASILIREITEEGMLQVRANVFGQEWILRGTHTSENGKQKFNLYRGSSKSPKNIFDLTLEGSELSGTYKQNNSDTPCRVVLARKEFRYNPDVMLTDANEIVDWYNPKKEETPKTKGKAEAKTKTKTKRIVYERPQYRFSSEGIEKINASTTKLTEESLKNFTKLDLEILRNTIYARHGFTFKKEFLRDLFNATDWYVPVSDNVDAELTTVEKQNITLLIRMEKYATDHYEYFGR